MSRERVAVDMKLHIQRPINILSVQSSWFLLVRVYDTDEISRYQYRYLVSK